MISLTTSATGRHGAAARPQGAFFLKDNPFDKQDGGRYFSSHAPI
jgi:hypothetical protein